MQSPITRMPPLCPLLCWHPGPGHHHLYLRLAPALPASFSTPCDGLKPLTPTCSPQSDLKCHQSLSFPGFPSHFSWKPASLPQSQGSLYRCHFYPNAPPPHSSHLLPLVPQRVAVHANPKTQQFHHLSIPNRNVHTYSSNAVFKGIHSSVVNSQINRVHQNGPIMEFIHENERTAQRCLKTIMWSERGQKKAYCKIPPVKSSKSMTFQTKKF